LREENKEVNNKIKCAYKYCIVHFCKHGYCKRHNWDSII